jgi:hypothetical protein
MKLTAGKKPNIVHTCVIGRSRIHIASDCLKTTPEQIEKVLDEFHAAGWRIAEKLAREGNKV